MFSWIKRMSSLKQGVEALDCANLAADWPVFKTRFAVYLRKEERKIFADGVPEETELDCFRVDEFYDAIGPEGRKIFHESFPNTDEKFTDITLDMAKGAFEALMDKQNLAMESFKFHSMSQRKDQSFQEFHLEIKQQAARCGFKCVCSKSFEERMIKDRVVAGVNSHKLQLRLLDMKADSLEAVIDACKSFEAAQRNIKLLDDDKGDEKEKVIDVVGKKVTSSRACFGCGQPWTEQHKAACRLRNIECFKCGMKGHLQKTCKKQPRRQKVNTIAEETGVFKIRIVKINLLSDSKWKKKYFVGRNLIDFKLDTGADANLIPIRFVPRQRIKKTNVRLFDYNDLPIEAFGEVNLICIDPHSGVRHVGTFIVVGNERVPILGSEACDSFNIIKRVDINVVSDGESFVLKNKSVFCGLGKIPGQVSIKLKKDAKPVLHYKKRFPLHLVNKLKDELKEMVNKGVISPVDYPTEWVNNLQVVEKLYGKLRICIDPRALNECIQREHYLIPTIEDLTVGLVGKKIFSVLDLTHGFWQLELDEESSLLTTFMSPFGRFKFNRVPFGISCIPELFQKKMVQIFGDIDGVTIYFDDFCIAGEDEASHDRTMAEVLRRAMENNITFNAQKMQYKRKQVTFMGHIISDGTLSVNEKNKNSILNMKTPVDKDGVHRFLGMLKYVSRFIPNLSASTAHLRELTKNNFVFRWGKKQNEEFEALKKVVASDKFLGIYNPTKEVTIQTDASKNGLGCVIMQEGRPMAYASRTLSKSEEKFAQIEKELLAIVFACKRFHFYVYGRDFLVQSDHKPLETLLKKDIDEVPMRLQRMMLILLRYPGMEVKFTPGKEIVIADCLSRAQLGDIEEVPELKEMIHVVAKKTCVTPNNLEYYKEMLKKDDQLVKICGFIENKWPGYHKLDSFCQGFYKLKNELHFENGLLLWGDRLVIPQGLQEKLSIFVHESHLGYEKTLARAKQLYYWIRMDKDIKQVVERCRICEKFSRNNAREPLQQDDIPKFPFHIVGMDLFEYEGKDFISILDSYSNRLVSIPLVNKTSKHIIDKLREKFIEIGFPTVIRADNSPFGSVEFQIFEKDFNIKFKYSSPRYAQSNGLAEKGVAIAKSMLKKCVRLVEESDIRN